MLLLSMQYILLVSHSNIIFGPIFASLVWSSTQYTGLLDDYLMLAICMGLGMAMKYFKFSRVSFLIGFILSYRLETTYVQFNTFGYGWEELLLRPMVSSGIYNIDHCCGNLGLIF